MTAPSARSSRDSRGKRGFTLVEIMVSLVAGLFIAMAVIALAKTATNTFHEEVRAATVEASLRIASERLRNDLSRVAFMGTGNNLLDPQAARPVGGQSPGQRYPNMQNLQGLRINFQGATVATHPVLLANGLAPDSLVISGNLATDDAYRMQWNPAVAGACGGPHLEMLPAADAALLRLIGGTGFTPATANALVQAAFTPAAGTFFARAVDDRGCAQYVEICASGFDGTRVFVDVRPSAADVGLLTPNNTGDNCGGSPLQTEFSVSPLVVVTWDLIPSNSALLAAATTVSLAPDPGIEPAANKFLLVRQRLAANGAVVGAPEIVSEYGVDMKFGTISSAPVVGAPVGAPVIADMDPAGPAAQNSTPLASTTVLGGVGPQRVRAVRYRLSVRTALPDRRTNLSIFPVATTSNAPYIVRYCTNDNLATCATWARVRTLVSEVPLINQARFNW